mmetsp:Transcript_14306/g.36533  ORF Transcript_14306/g.36533 Transcript_14306/m.36533 type:complete len:150 (-) Transcript_14306:57-506(-)
MWTGKKGSQPDDFQMKAVNMSKAALLTNDPKLNFIMQSFDGDLILGLNLITQALKEEAADILSVAVMENQILYSIHVLVTVLCFYLVLFRNTMFSALKEVDVARKFVIRMPLHVLNHQNEIDLIMNYFHNEKEEDEDEHGEDDQDEPNK